MARSVAAAWVVAAIVSFGSAARAQPALIGVGVQDADPPTADDAPRQLLPCNCRLVPELSPLDPNEVELTSAIVASASVAGLSYIMALTLASRSNGASAVSAIPVFGAIVTAQRNHNLDDSTTPLLLFSAGVQAIGILVAAVAGADLARLRRRVEVDLSVSPAGGCVSTTWRF